MKNIKIIITSFLLVIWACGSAYAACTAPAGVAGAREYFPAQNNYYMCDGTNWKVFSKGCAAYTPNSVNFNGSTYICHPTVGPAASKQWSFSGWFRRTNLGTWNVIFGTSYPTTPDNSIDIMDDNRLLIGGQKTAGGAYILHIESTGTINDTNWHHLMFSVDLSNVAKRHVYLDGSPLAVTYFQYTNDFIDFSSYAGFGENCPTSALQGIPFYGDMADMWMDFDTYIDLSVAANREKFITSAVKPVYLGANGQYPTGTSPEIYLTGATASWETNKGASGGFTENGALTNGTAPPTGIGCMTACPTTPAQFEYNTGSHIYKMCDGTAIYDVTCPSGNCGTLGACTKDGEVNYFSGTKELAYCNGTNWRVMAR